MKKILVLCTENKVWKGKLEAPGVVVGTAYWATILDKPLWKHAFKIYGTMYSRHRFEYKNGNGECK